MLRAAVPKARLGEAVPKARFGGAVPKARWLVLLGLWSLGCAAEPELEGAALRVQAQELWQTRCATCHGLGGRGDGPTGRGLTPRPRDFTDAGWQAQADDGRLRRVIVEGGAALGLSAEMAANVDLERRPAMVGALIEIVRGFATQAATQVGRDTK